MKAACRHALRAAPEAVHVSPSTPQQPSLGPCCADPVHETKAVLAWSRDTLVLTFRGTASLTNALSDIQVCVSSPACALRLGRRDGSGCREQGFCVGAVRRSSGPEGLQWQLQLPALHSRPSAPGMLSGLSRPSWQQVMMTDHPPRRGRTWLGAPDRTLACIPRLDQWTHPGAGRQGPGHGGVAAPQQEPDGWTRANPES